MDNGLAVSVLDLVGIRSGEPAGSAIALWEGLAQHFVGIGKQMNLSLSNERTRSRSDSSRLENSANTCHVPFPFASLRLSSRELSLSPVELQKANRGRIEDVRMVLAEVPLHAAIL